MSDCTVGAPVRATKAPTRAKAAPSPAPLVAPAVGANEQAIAATGAALLEQAAQCIHTESGTVYAGTLLELGQKLLQQASAGNVSMGSIQEVFYFAAGTCTGALAIEQRDFPGALHRHHLISTAFELLNNAGLSYDCDINANAVAAAAVEAGARQFRDRPSPPIRRVDMDETGAVTAETHTHLAGKHGVKLMIQCAYDIEGIADAVTNMGDEPVLDGEPGMAALLRCYGTRIKALNSMVISHLDRDIIKLSNVQHALYRGARHLPTGALE